MTTLTGIRFTQEQARTMTGVSVETCRHWRKTVPYLAEKSGKAARFTLAEAVGLEITAELVGDFGVHISSMRRGVDQLFRLLADTNVGSLARCIALITPTTATLHDRDSRALRSLSTAMIVMPLAPVLIRVQQRVFPEATTLRAQTNLPFPPRIVRSVP